MGGEWGGGGVLSVGNNMIRRKQTRRVNLSPHLDSLQPPLFVCFRVTDAGKLLLAVI